MDDLTTGTNALGSLIALGPSDRITRPDGQTIVVDGPYVLSMPGEYLLEVDGADPLSIWVE